MCLNWFRETLKRGQGRKVTVGFVVTEIIRWVCIGVPIFLSVWRYGALRGYTVFIPGVNLHAQFWGMTTLIFLLASILLYLPLKLFYIRRLFNTRKLYGWRPSILLYIIACGLPCFTIILVAIQTQPNKPAHMDPATATVLQGIVFGLTISEWMAKIREEELSYDLITAMSVDFFFAYDVIEILMMASHETNIFRSNWIYACFGCALLAMFKYIPEEPKVLNAAGNPRGLVTCILFSMICNDIPFIVVRLTTMIRFGLNASDFIHPLKNIALIIFNIIQLYIIWNNHKRHQRKRFIKEKRCSRRNPDGSCVCEEEVTEEVESPGMPSVNHPSQDKLVMKPQVVRTGHTLH